MASNAERAREKIRRHRDRLRADGLRPIQLWVPDVRTAAFRDAARDQALAVAMSGWESGDQTFIDAISREA